MQSTQHSELDTRSHAEHNAHIRSINTRLHARNNTLDTTELIPQSACTQLRHMAAQYTHRITSRPQAPSLAEPVFAEQIKGSHLWPQLINKAPISKASAHLKSDRKLFDRQQGRRVGAEG